MSQRYPPVTTYFRLGKVLKSHGTDGRMRVQVEDQFAGYFKAGEFVFLNLAGSQVPFGVRDFETAAHQVMALEGVETKDQSDSLAGLEIAIPTEQVRARHRRTLAVRQSAWVGYVIADLTSGQRFEIVRTEEFPQQLMAVVDLAGREVLIPLHDDLIDQVDEEAQVVTMRLPEGLLDL